MSVNVPLFITSCCLPGSYGFFNAVATVVHDRGNHAFVVISVAAVLVAAAGHGDGVCARGAYACGRTSGVKIGRGSFDGRTSD